jgi:hypothetical protein
MVRSYGACLPSAYEDRDDEASHRRQGELARAFARACGVVVYEVIGACVLRAADDAAWIDGDAAAPFLAAHAKIGGSAPYSMFPEPIDADLYVSNLEESPRVLSLPGTPLDGKRMSNMDEAIARMRAFIDDLPDEPHVSFWKELLDQMKLCRRYRMIFRVNE